MTIQDSPGNGPEPRVPPAESTIETVTLQAAPIVVEGSGAAPPLIQDGETAAREQTSTDGHDQAAGKTHDQTPPNADGQSNKTHECDACFVQRLRDVATEVRSLQDFLRLIHQGEILLSEGHVVLTQKVDAIKQGLRKVRLAARHVSEKFGLADDDAVTRVDAIWQTMQASPLLNAPPTDNSLDAQTLLRHLTFLDEQCNALVLEIAHWTIPSRLADWLKNGRPGYYVPFHAVFDDEIPNYEDRARILRFIAYSPASVINGLIEPDTGLIYYFSPKWYWQVLSALLLAAALTLTVGLVVGACYLGVPNWPFANKDVSKFLVGWLAVLLGVVIHTAVSTVKHAQAQGGKPPVISPRDLLPWMNAKLGPLLMQLLLTLMGFFGLAFSLGPDGVTPLNAFLVGYSLDSILELLNAGLQQQSAALIPTLKQQLGVAMRT
jgi:hypothetical protein